MWFLTPLFPDEIIPCIHSQHVSTSENIGSLSWPIEYSIMLGTQNLCPNSVKQCVNKHLYNA